MSALCEGGTVQAAMIGLSRSYARLSTCGLTVEAEVEDLETAQNAVGKKAAELRGTPVADLIAAEADHLWPRSPPNTDTHT